MTHKILVIDDEESICDILKFNLMKDGFEVDCAFSAVEALTLDLSQYSLLIVDIMMEGVNGFEFVKQISDKAETKLLPVIFCSALDNEDNKVMGLDIGADDYITKPFDLKIVSLRVKSVLKRCYPELNQ